MKRKIRLLLAVVLAMAMVMGSSVTALAKEFTGCSSGSPYKISEMKTGDTLKVYTGDNRTIYVINDTGRTLHVYAQTIFCEEVCFTDKEPEEESWIHICTINAGDGGNWSLVGVGDTATVTIRMSAPVPPDNTPEHVHSFTWQTIYEATPDSDGLEGEVCSCGATRNTQKISAYVYALNDYATSMINAAKSGQTMTFEFGEWNSFPKSFMAKLVDKSAQNVTFVFHYNWNHVKQEITIPAGTPIDLNFDWYGPAKMAELYGAN